MTESCRTECGTQVTYEKITFSDGIFFSIPIEINGRLHNCINIEHADQDLTANAGLASQVPEPDCYYPPDMPSSQKFNLVPFEDRKKYRRHLMALDTDVLFHLEDKLGFKEDREEMRKTIGFYLNNIFTNHHVDLEPMVGVERVYTDKTHKDNLVNEVTERLSIIFRIIGMHFTFLELLGFFYLIEGFYADAKKCFEIISEPPVDPAEQSLLDQLPPEVYGIGNKAIIDLMEQRIMQNNVGKDGIKNIGGMWFDENWSEDLLNYWKETKKNQHQGDEMKSNYQSQTSLDADLINDLKQIEEEISDEEVRNKIREFEKDVLRPVVRRTFPSEKEMDKKLKTLKWGHGKSQRGTLYDKALFNQDTEEDDDLKSKDPMNVGMLRFLDIGDMANIIPWPMHIFRYLKDIAKRRHKLSGHPNDYDKKTLKHVNNMVDAEIGLCERYFETEFVNVRDLK